jgi:hypothetical protein
MREVIHKLILTPPAKGYGKIAITYQGEHLKDSYDPIHSAARFLLETGRASEGDLIQTYRKKPNNELALCLSGRVGPLAKKTVWEDEEPEDIARLKEERREFVRSLKELERKRKGQRGKISPKTGAKLYEPGAKPTERPIRKPKPRPPRPPRKAPVPLVAHEALAA